jgi:peptide/nickel transport system ATP-binding protein
MPEAPGAVSPTPERDGRAELARSMADEMQSHPLVLEAHHLTKHYRQRRARRRGLRAAPAVVHAAENVEIELRAGLVVALVGESGSGKSTVARLLAHLVRPTSGEIILDGRPAPGMRSREYRRIVQMVFQDPFSSLNPVHSVAYHLERPLKIHHRATRSEMREAVARLLTRVQLEPVHQFIDKLPHELSGGQRQRVAIARALAADPRVLLADEPISMLDVSIRLGILNLLGQLRDEEGLAILYVTHDIASARYFADTMTVMYAGQMVESGPSRIVADEPAHPYTQLLLRAAPDPDRSEPVHLGATGGPPSLVHPPQGCRFHPRCPVVMDRCRHEAPPQCEVAPGHIAACWQHAERRVSIAVGRTA